MKTSRVTLKDIAAECGCSANTVSRALRGDSRLSDSTREHICRIARQMGYIPNYMATALRSGRSHMIAVIVNDLRNQHYCDLVNRMDRDLREQGYKLMILCKQLDESLAEELIHTAISLSVDGVLYFPGVGQSPYLEYMRTNNMPFVLLDRRVDDAEADTVRCDDEQGGCLAGCHLADLGHRRFLFLSGVARSSSQIDRLNGFLKALKEKNIPEENVRIVSGEEVEDALEHHNTWELLQPMDYTAIVSFRDEVAYPVMNDLRDHGISIPKDISIISFDNLHQEDPTRPYLTSIYTTDSIAGLGVKMLLERIEQPDLPARNMILPVRICEGGTTGRVFSDSSIPAKRAF